MTAPAVGRLRVAPAAESALDTGLVLNALPTPVLVSDGAGRFAQVNLAAEQFFRTGANALLGRALAEVVPADSPLMALVAQVREAGNSVTEYGVTIETPRIGSHYVSIDAAPVTETSGWVVVSLKERSIARKIDHQLTHRNAARSVTAMAAMLAHEVKNPLSGIRGAAQLLEQNATAEERTLTDLICEETDRIVALVDRMEMFADQQPIERGPVNIHEILEHVRRLAQSGFARNLRFVERYDPSLPAVLGNRDLLIQALLNLIKNAAEAVSGDGGEIILASGFKPGVRLAFPGGPDRIDLPLVIGVQDNGPGVPENLRAHLFDPFVTSKVGGKGLGLALVAKIVGDHGGVIEFESEPGRTLFRMLLPMADRDEAGP
jgi:two-component system nitrogen regulation sensor histidine kinase GlnL